MAVNLIKGQKVSLKKENGIALSRVMVGLGWDPVKKGGKGIFGSLFGGGGEDVDCDASVFLLQDGHLMDIDDIVYFGNLEHESGAVRHCGDNLTGEGDGDDEQIIADLARIPAQYNKLVFVVNIYKAHERKQHFGMIENAYIRIVDDTSKEFCRYSLTDSYDGMTAMTLCEIYRYKGEWKISAIGQGSKDSGLQEMSKKYLLQ